MAGTLPAHLRGTTQEIQFTAGYKDSEAAKSSQQSDRDAWAAFQTAKLDRSIAAREAEIRFLEEAYLPGEGTFRHESCRRAPLYKVPRDEVDPATGAVVNVVWVENPSAVELRDSVMADVGVYAHRAMSIALNVARQETLKFEKRRDLAAKAQVAASDGDTVMGDATLSTALKAEVKRLVMGVMPRDLHGHASPGAGSSKLTKKARVAAAHVQATVTGKGTGYEEEAVSRARHTKERIVVVAKAEGSKPKRKRGRKQQQQNNRSSSLRGKEKEKRRRGSRCTGSRWTLTY
ncbi:hypothetical protein EDB86DRAFT_2837987 [Lactarius hatsudake]|nr:hypothetical protein EDB86DRAFT_2837987 [Lactarius hatsudake]